MLLPVYGAHVTGFIRDGFVPSVRPGATPECYLGALQKKECPAKA